jgi:predicted ester cyclase
MALDLDRLLAVWDAPPGSDAGAAFGALYTDPFLLNGVATPVAALVSLSERMHTAIADQRREILEVVTAGAEKVAVAFVVRGRHVGPLRMRLGTVAPTGKPVEMAVIDIFTLADGLITEVRAVSDELGMLLGLGAVRLAGTA